MNANQEFKIIGVIGDVHAEDQLLEGAIEFLRKQGIETILCVGDIADGQGNVDKCCQILLKEKITAVLGNHDQWLLKNQMRDLMDATLLDDISNESKDFLSALPTTYDFQTPGGLSLLCHGLGENDMARLTPYDYGYAIEFNEDLQNLIKDQKYKYIINGHTHYRMVRSFGKLTIVNAGTLKRNNEPGFISVDFQHGIVQFLKFNSNCDIEKAETLHLE